MWPLLFISCISPRHYDPPEDTGGGTDSGGDSGQPDQTVQCPETPFAGDAEGLDYAAYPVYIQGTDRRFQSIQDGIWGSENGDTVVVCPGHFTENIDFVGREITLTSAEGPAHTTIDGGGLDATVLIGNYEPAETVLQGFTITNGIGFGTGTPHGGGVYIEWGSPTVRYNHVVGNESAIAGGIYQRNASATVHNNVVAWNRATEGGGGIVCSACGGAWLYNTIYLNDSEREGPVGEYFWGAGDLVGNIFVAPESAEAAFRWLDPREDKEWRSDHNLLWPAIDVVPPNQDADQWPSTEGWVYADPQLGDPDNGNWSLGADSPAIDAGPPDESDPDGGRADLGATGGPWGEWPW